MNVKDYLCKVALEEGATYENVNLWAIDLLADSEELSSGDTVSYNTHYEYDAVVKVKSEQYGDRYIRFEKYVITGDYGLSELGLGYDLDAAEFVEPKTHVITETFYV